MRTNLFMLNSGAAEARAAVGNPAELKIALDKIILYLRIVHSIDFYNQVSALAKMRMYDFFPADCSKFQDSALRKKTNPDSNIQEKKSDSHPI